MVEFVMVMLLAFVPTAVPALLTLPPVAVVPPVPLLLELDPSQPNVNRITRAKHPFARILQG